MVSEVSRSDSEHTQGTYLAGKKVPCEQSLFRVELHLKTVSVVLIILHTCGFQREHFYFESQRVKNWWVCLQFLNLTSAKSLGSWFGSVFKTAYSLDPMMPSPK